MYTLETFCQQILFITTKIWAPTESHSLLLGTQHVRKVIAQRQKPSWPVCMSKGFWYSTTACQAPWAQWGQGQNSSASAGRKSNSLPTIFSTNICHCLQAEAYLGLLWSFLRVLLICAHSAVSPTLLLTKELMKSTWRPKASCKTQGGEQLVFSDSSGS